MEHNSEDKKGNLIFYLEMKKKINKITNSYWYFQNSCQKGYKKIRDFFRTTNLLLTSFAMQSTFISLL